MMHILHYTDVDVLQTKQTAKGARIMKSYSVKSNAKRFARGIAAKYPETFEAAEPIPVEPGAREWLPALNVIGPEREAVGFVQDDVSATCVLANAEKINIADAIDDIAAAVDASGLKAAFDAVEPAGDIDAVAPKTPAYSATTTKTEQTLAEMAAALPPPTKSTPEEIAARRAERRNRIDAEKKAGTFGKKPEKINKKKTILDLIRREDGATQAELEAATGWQRHTLRGYIAGTLRKQMAPLGKVIECERGRGDVPTRYFMEDAKKESA